MNIAYRNAYEEVMSIEGGYANDPTDKGGETYMGVARKKWPKWEGWKYLDSKKSNPGFPSILRGDYALYEMVMKFYYDNFWLPNRLDELKNANIKREIFDTSVNQGPTIGVRYLQRALNLLNRNGRTYKDTIVDGHMGAETIRLTNNHPDPQMVYDLMNTMQGAKYIAICEADKTQEKYMNGWLTRVYE